MLIKAITGREVPSGGLPANAGCVVHNVGTLKALSEAFRLGKPLIDRALTVSGGACANPPVENVIRRSRPPVAWCTTPANPPACRRGPAGCASRAPLR